MPANKRSYKDPDKMSLPPNGRDKATTRLYNQRYIPKWRFRTYGLTPEAYDILLAKHDGSCHICKQIKNLSIDHRHTTGEVRGLLCTNCNTALGSFKDDVALLKRAIEYLEDSAC